MKDLFTRAKLAVRESPSLFKIYYSTKEIQAFHARVIRPHFDIVIEGYPRSANTFATFAFLSAQPRNLRVANHFHNSAQFVLAFRYRVPAMLCLRAPDDATRSFMLFRPELDPREIILRYIEFHRRLLPVRDGFIVAPFEEIITNFGRSIERLNSKFGTDFGTFSATEQSTSRIFREISEYQSKRNKILKVEKMNPNRETIPNAEKFLNKEKAEKALRRPSLEALRREAFELYRTLRESAP